MKALFFGLMVVGLFSFACSYEPEGEYLNGIQEPVQPSDVEISLGDILDTLFVRFYSKEVNFIINTSPYNIVVGKLYVNGEYVTLLRSGQNSFYLPLHNMFTGYNSVKLEFTTNTRTGSIAEISGAEFFLYTKEFKVFKHTSELNELILSGEIVNGSYLLKWDKYVMPDFLQYKLNCSKDGIIYQSNNADSNSYVDSTIIEGWLKGYNLDFKVKEKGWAGQSSWINPSYKMKPLKCEYLSERKVRLSWEATDLPKNLRKYQIYEYINGIYKLLFETSDWQKCECIFEDVPYGYTNFYLVFVPKDDDWVFDSHNCSEVRCDIGENVLLTNCIPLAYYRKLIRLGTEYLEQVDELTGIATEKKDVPTASARIIYSTSEKAIFSISNNSITAIDGNDFSRKKTVLFSSIKSSSAFLNDFDIANCPVSCDDSGNLYFYYLGNINDIYEKQIRYRYNWNTNKLERIIGPPMFIRNGIEFSSDGKCLVLDNIIVYDLVGNTFVKRVVLQEVHSMGGNYLNSINNQLIAYGGSTVVKYNVFDLTQFETIDFNEGHIVGFSPSFEQVLVRLDENDGLLKRYKVFDLLTGKELLYCNVKGYGLSYLLFKDYAYISGYRIPFEN
jgi:hypothetical protein